MDYEQIRRSCKEAKDVSQLLQTVGMEELTKFFTTANITDLAYLSQMYESDLKQLRMKTGQRKKVLEVIKILKEELPKNELTASQADSGVSVAADCNIGCGEYSQQYIGCPGQHSAVSGNKIIIEKCENELERCKKELDRKRHLLTRINKQVKQFDNIFESVREAQGLALKLESQSRKEVASVTVQELTSDAVSCLNRVTCSPLIAKDKERLHVNTSVLSDKVINKENLHPFNYPNGSPYKTVKLQTKFVQQQPVDYKGLSNCRAQVNYGRLLQNVPGQFSNELPYVAPQPPCSAYPPRFNPPISPIYQPNQYPSQHYNSVENKLPSSLHPSPYYTSTATSSPITVQQTSNLVNPTTPVNPYFPVNLGALTVKNVNFTNQKTYKNTPLAPPLFVPPYPNRTPHHFQQHNNIETMCYHPPVQINTERDVAYPKKLKPPPRRHGFNNVANNRRP